MNSQRPSPVTAIRTFEPTEPIRKRMKPTSTSSAPLAGRASVASAMGRFYCAHLLRVRLPRAHRKENRSEASEAFMARQAGRHWVNARKSVVFLRERSARNAMKIHEYQ